MIDTDGMIGIDEEGDLSIVNGIFILLRFLKHVEVSARVDHDCLCQEIHYFRHDTFADMWFVLSSSIIRPEMANKRFCNKSRMIRNIQRVLIRIRGKYTSQNR
jgi:hypothetical protein